MSVTLVGLPIILLGLWLLVRGTTESLFFLTAFTTLMGGSAAIIAGALGGASLQPATVLLVMLVAKVALTPRVLAGEVPAAVSANAALIGYAAYAVVAAFVLPRLFAGAIDVAPMKVGGGRWLLHTEPLRPSPQNVTQAFYIAGTAAMAVCAALVVRRPGGARLVVRLALLVAFVHAGLGLADLALNDTPGEVIFDVLRNANYSQNDHRMRGFSRIDGIMPEASAYGAYGMAWLVLTTELWLRRVRPRATGLAALGLALTLALTLSSGTVVALGAYGVLLAFRLAFAPGSIGIRRLVLLMCGGLLVATLTLGALVFLPRFSATLTAIYTDLTVEKADSTSGQQRMFWAMQGLHAFAASFGLGIGPGSFRSSSLVTAVIGSTGLIGGIALLGHLWVVFKPLRPNTYRTRLASEASAVGAACGWAAIVGLLPACLVAAGADPGLAFGALAGAAVALRGPARRAAPVPKARIVRPVSSWQPPAIGSPA